MADLIPNRKVGTAGTVGALSVVLIWTVGLFHLDMPAEVGAAIAALLTTGAGYLTPQKPN